MSNHPPSPCKKRNDGGSLVNVLKSQPLFSNTDADTVEGILIIRLYSVALAIHGDAAAGNAKLLSQQFCHLICTLLCIAGVDLRITGSFVSITGDGHLCVGELLHVGSDVLNLFHFGLADL